eukprot:RCo000913
MRLQKKFGLLPVLYLLGFLVCLVLHPGTNDTAGLGPTADDDFLSQQRAARRELAPSLPGSGTAVQQSPEPASCEPNLSTSSGSGSSSVLPHPATDGEGGRPCKCAGGQKRGSPADFSADLERREALLQSAVPCVDEYSVQRGSPPTASMVLAQCALRWLEHNVQSELVGPPVEQTEPGAAKGQPPRLRNITLPKILLDYTYTGMEFVLPRLTGPDWVYLTALLPQVGLPLPRTRPVMPNQLVLAPPTYHRVMSLFVTNTLFDLQLVLRLEEYLQAVAPLPFEDALAKMLGMSRVTYLMLPCGNSSGSPGKSEGERIKEAVRAVLRTPRDMGLHQLDVQVESVAAFQYEGCVRELLKVVAIKIHRGVRLKWCYYPLGTKYDLIYRKDDMVQLVHRYVMQWTRFGGDKVKTIRKWYPSINMGDLLGWGLDLAQREVLFWDMLTQASCPDPAIQNWLLSRGGRVVRIDPNQQSWKNKFPVGRNYIEFLKLFLCVEKGTWKQKFDSSVPTSCMSCQGGNLIHASEDGKWKFYNTQLWARTDKGTYASYPLGDAVQANEYPKCPACNVCVMHPFRSLKMIWHNERSLPPAACTECYRCQRKLRLEGPGVTLNASEYHGCTDVEGVPADTPPPNPDYCYDTQKKPIPRPSAPPEVVKKGFFS